MPSGPRSKNSDYWVYIVNRVAGVQLLADLPESFSISAQSQYEAVDGNGFFNLRNRSAIAAQIAGGGAILQRATKQIWAHTAPLAFHLPLIFDAETNSLQDVHEKMAILQSMVLPRLEGPGVLGPPNGRSILGQEKAVSLQIGKQFLFDDCIITGASLITEQRLNNGYPIAGQIDLNIETNYVLSREDYLLAAGLTGAAQASANIPRTLPGGITIPGTQSLPTPPEFQ